MSLFTTCLRANEPSLRMLGLGSFNLINEFERASNELNAEQLASSSARLQP